MALSHKVESDGFALPAAIVRLTEPELTATMEDWRSQCDLYGPLIPAKAKEAAYEWDWLQAGRLRLGRIYGLRVEDSPRAVGLLAATLGGKTKGGRSCLDVVFLAKAPRAFAAPTIRGIGRCLVAEAVSLSFRYAMDGRIRIREALRNEASGYSPSTLYREMGFEGMEAFGTGVEYEDLEISTASAERLLRRLKDGE